jgi:hypothetical protein
MQNPHTAQAEATPQFQEVGPTATPPLSRNAAIEGFEQLTRDFDRGLDRLSGKQLLVEIRQVCVNAGRLLLRAIEANLVKAPEKPPPWLDFVTGGGGEVRFVGFQAPDGGSSSSSEGFPFPRFVLAVASLQGINEEDQAFDHLKASHLESFADDFEKRHAFVEAVTGWLCPETGAPKLSEWVCTSEGHGQIRFLSDWISAAQAASLARACREVCRVLAKALGQELLRTADLNRWDQHRDGTKLIGWHDILTALGLTVDEQNRKRIRRYHEKYGGPITWVGPKPHVDRGVLLAWWARLEHWVELAKQQDRSVRELASPHLQKNEGLHEERRPNARGKAK